MAKSKSNKNKTNNKRARVESVHSSLDSSNEFLDRLLKDDNSLKVIIADLLKHDKAKNEIITHLQPNLQVINSLLDKITHLEDRIDDLEQYSRRTCLKFSGVPEDRNENTDSIINNEILYDLNIHLSIFDIGRSHRVGKPRPNQPRDIIVRFISYRSRALVFRNKSYLKNYNNHRSFNIFVNEALTKQRSVIFGKVRSLFKARAIEGCWTNDGRIVAKTHQQKLVTIQSEAEFLEFSKSISDKVSGASNDPTVDRNRTPRAPTPKSGRVPASGPRIS